MTLKEVVGAIVVSALVVGPVSYFMVRLGWMWGPFRPWQGKEAKTKKLVLGSLSLIGGAAGIIVGAVASPLNAPSIEIGAFFAVFGLLMLLS